MVYKSEVPLDRFFPGRTTPVPDELMFLLRIDDVLFWMEFCGNPFFSSSLSPDRTCFSSRYFVDAVCFTEPPEPN